MPHRIPQLASFPYRTLPACEYDGSSHRRRAFTLTELLVVVSIILVLMSLIGGAVSAARGSQKKQATKALIAKLNAIVQQQYATYSSRFVGSATAELTAAARRQMVTGDMPDNWAEVRALKEGTTGLASLPARQFPLNAAQRSYVKYYESVSPSPKFEDAECLFMIVMIGGIADCLDCGGLGLSEKGDKDGDQAPEFWDAWGNPIGLVTWPAGLALPPGGDNFFSATAPFSSGPSAVAPGGIMRPLIYSSGPDGKSSVGTPNTGNSDFIAQIKTGTNCGNPVAPTVAVLGGMAGDPPDQRADNITNFDDEVAK